MLKSLVTASTIALLVAGCSPGSQTARRSTIAVSSVGFAAGTGMVAGAYRTDQHASALWTGLGLAVVSAMTLSNAAAAHPPDPEVAPAPIAGSVRVPGLAPVVLR